MNLTENREPAMFLPFQRLPDSQSFLVVRSNRDPQQLAALIRSQLRQLDAGLPVRTATWTSLLDVVLFPSRMASLSLGVLGMMGAMLSITGVFAMAAYSVSKRLRELGIRVALGGQRRQVL
jgi:ABC-type antimicrobial peptide transport system permease subunit